VTSNNYLFTFDIKDWQGTSALPLFSFRDTSDTPHVIAKQDADVKKKDAVFKSFIGKFLIIKTFSGISGVHRTVKLSPVPDLHPEQEQDKSEGNDIGSNDR
jgi:hypothetical protein